MSNPKDPRSDSAKKPEDARTEPTAVGDLGGDRRSGRVAYDSRGNPIWEWQLETGVYTRDVSTQRLKKLDLGELSLADTAIHKQPGEVGGQHRSSDPHDKGASGGGFDPYDKGASGEGFNPYDNARSLGNRMNDRSAPPPARKPTDLRKLDEWMKLKKNVKEQKDD